VILAVGGDRNGLHLFRSQQAHPSGGGRLAGARPADESGPDHHRHGNRHNDDHDHHDDHPGNDGIFSRSARRRDAGSVAVGSIGLDGSEFPVDQSKTSPVTGSPDREETGRSSQARIDALLDELGEESFPASDPPGTWAGGDRESRSDR
jgi:hypothetical protein